MTNTRSNSNHEDDDDEKKETTRKMKSRSYSMVGCILVALLSFLAGIFTPRSSSHTSIFINKHIESVRHSFFSPRPTKTNSNNNNNNNSNSCNDEALSHFLHKQPIQGMHVVCVTKERDGENDGKTILRAKFFPEACYNNIDDEKNPKITTPKNIIDLKATGTTTSNNGLPSWRTVRNAFKGILNLRTINQGSLHQPWAIFTSNGNRIIGETEEDDIDDNGNNAIQIMVNSCIILVFEGGQWMWPGIEVGYRRQIALYTPLLSHDATQDDNDNDEVQITSIALETLSIEPLVISVENFLSYDECDYIVKTAEPRMEQSPVVLQDHDAGKDATEFRTSQTTFLESYNDTILSDIEYRVASLTRIPIENQEDLQVLRYGLGQHYVQHTDYFDPDYIQNNEEMLEMIEYGKTNRYVTVFWYMSNVEEGGETSFPQSNKNKINGTERYLVNHCNEGLRVKPTKGKVIIFYSLYANGQMNEKSLHSACPVKNGIKWAANKWIWNAPQDDYDDYEQGEDEDEGDDDE